MRDPRRLRWAPMLPPQKLIRLYEANAVGLLDDELLDEVGWRLWERLRDVVLVTSGRVRCPMCRTEFPVRAPGRAADIAVPCPGGDWWVTEDEWHRSWEHRDLNGNCHDFSRFVEAWPAARTARERMLLIDTVVHGLHVSSRTDASGNFAARNFLEGSRPKVVAILDELAYGTGSAVAVGARDRWLRAREEYRSSRARRRS